MATLVPEKSLKTEAVRLHRGLSLYKQPLGPGRGSPNWYARAHLDVGGRRLHTRSTRTTDRRLAEEKAHELWAELTLTKKHGAGFDPITGRSTVLTYRFDRVADQWIDEKRRDAGSDPRKLRRYRDYRQVTYAGNGLARYFKRTDIASITTADIRDYLRFAQENSKSGALSPGTQKSHLAALRGILGYAFERRMIGTLPSMPKIRQVDNPRPWFSLEEYKALRKAAAAKMRAAVHNPAEFARWAELRDFIGFMTGSCLRPSEWKALRQRDVEIVGGEHFHLALNVAEGKTKPRTSVTMRGAVHAYRRILARRGRNPDAFVFLDQYWNRETALAKMRGLFDALLRESGLTFDRFGRKRCLYSLRHTAIMLRLLEGVNVYDLARNAGTSVGQIERFYGSHLDPTMRVAELQKSRFRG